MDKYLKKNTVPQSRPMQQLVPLGKTHKLGQPKPANTNYPVAGNAPSTYAMTATAGRSAGTRVGIAKRQNPLTIPNRNLQPSIQVSDDWDSLPLVASQNRQHFLSGVPLVNFFRRSSAATAFDQLRTNLLQTLRGNGWNRIAIAAPTRDCGATFTAVNLAQSLARIPGSRTVLMDCNHHNPGIATMLGLNGYGDARGFLAGRVALDQHMVRVSETLALGLANGPDPDASEMLADRQSAATLARMKQSLRPDVIIYDLPPVLTHDDLAAFLPQIDAVLLVADGTKTIPSDLVSCDRVLDGHTHKLGVILNRARGTGSLSGPS